MSYISKIDIEGTSYDVKDAEARASIEEMACEALTDEEIKEVCADGVTVDSSGETAVSEAVTAYVNSAVATAVADKAAASDVYSKTEVDSLITDKADASDVYTKTEVDSLIASSSSETDNMPVGSIIMFGGTTIPDGWNICDGTNGTPNLIGSFIKAGTTNGETGGQTEITLTEENLPAHTHTASGTLTTEEAGSHTHTVGYARTYASSSSRGGYASNMASTGQTATTSESGGHTHTVDASGITLSSVGSGEPLTWEPKYYSLIFIMKIS